MSALHLFPTPLSDDVTFTQSLTPNGLQCLQNTRHFICENLKTARRHLATAHMPVPIAQLQMIEIPKNASAADYKALFTFVLSTEQVGLLSEAGCPAVADPGAVLVAMAHEHGVAVLPHIGPSSILLAIMASGLNGQSFSFVGYVPQEAQARILAVKTLEARSKSLNQTQILIETPYRNQVLLDCLKQNLLPSTRLSIAIDITGTHQHIQTLSIAQWRQKPDFVIGKIPTVFSLLAA